MKKTIFNLILLLATGWLLSACDSEGDKFDYDKVGLLISGTEQVPVQRFTVDELPAAYAVTVKATRRCPKDVTVHLAIDTALVREYNKTHGTAYYPVPASCVSLENSEVTIPHRTKNRISDITSPAPLARNTILTALTRSYTTPSAAPRAIDHRK